MKNLVRPTLLALVITVTAGCSQEPNLSAVDPKWDRDVCERCKMLLSDKNFSSEVINPTDGKHYFFDDLGCALNWLAEDKNKSWALKAIVFANDAKTGEWLDISKNHLALGYITPMSYGIAVFKSKDQISSDKKLISAKEAYEHALEVKKMKVQIKAQMKQ